MLRRDYLLSLLPEGDIDVFREGPRPTDHVKTTAAERSCERRFLAVQRCDNGCVTKRVVTRDPVDVMDVTRRRRVVRVVLWCSTVLRRRGCARYRSAH